LQLQLRVNPHAPSPLRSIEDPNYKNWQERPRSSDTEAAVQPGRRTQDL